MKTSHSILSLMGIALLAGCQSAPIQSAAEAVRIPADDDLAQLYMRSTTPVSETLWTTYINYDESKVKPYTLPEIKARNTAEWEVCERPATLQHFKDCLYGKFPGRPDRLRTQLLSEKRDALDNTAIRREIRIVCEMADGRSFDFDMLLYVPKNAVVPPPVFVGLNFSGNQYNTPEKDVRMTRAAVPQYDEHGWGYMVPCPESWRGRGLEAWNYRAAIQRGYAVAVAAAGEICPDHPNGFRSSVFTLFYPDRDLRPEWEIPFHEYKTEHWRRPVSVIGAWAWGLSRMLDALEKEPLVDAQRAVVIGHSRLGKAALWAGANDQRFKMVISNNSGCGGAALSRRNFGTDLFMHEVMSPHFFAGAAIDYAVHPETLPVDQHQLLALIAPRALYVASSSEDYGADFKGEFLAARAASPVWAFYGKSGIEPATELPAVDAPMGGDTVRYHLKRGKHSITAYDWQQYYDFADRVFGKR